MRELGSARRAIPHAAAAKLKLDAEPSGRHASKLYQTEIWVTRGRELKKSPGPVLPERAAPLGQRIPERREPAGRASRGSAGLRTPAIRGRSTAAAGHRSPRPRAAPGGSRGLRCASPSPEHGPTAPGTPRGRPFALLPRREARRPGRHQNPNPPKPPRRGCSPHSPRPRCPGGPAAGRAPRVRYLLRRGASSCQEGARAERGGSPGPAACPGA